MCVYVRVCVGVCACVCAWSCICVSVYAREFAHVCVVRDCERERVGYHIYIILISIIQIVVARPPFELFASEAGVDVCTST